MPYYNESVTDKIRNLMGEAGNTAKTIASHIDNKNGTSLASKQLQLQRAQYLQDLDNKVYSTSAKKALTGIESMLYGNSKTGAVGFFETQLNDMNYEGYEANTQSMLDGTLTVEYLTENFGMSEGHASKFIEEYGDTITSEATQRTQTNMWLSMTNQLGIDQKAFSEMEISKGGYWVTVHKSVAENYSSTGGRAWDISGSYDPNSQTVMLTMANDLGVVNAKKYIDSNITNTELSYEDLLNGGVSEWATVLSDADDGTTDLFKSLNISSQEAIKSALIEYINTQAGIASKTSESKQIAMNTYLAEAKINNTPITKEQFDSKAKEFGLDPYNVFDKNYIDSAWISQSSLNIQYEAQTLADEKEKQSAIDSIKLKEADVKRDQATVLEAQGDYTSAATVRIEASNMEWDILKSQMDELGLDTSKIEDLKTASATNLQEAGRIQQEEYDRKEAERVAQEQKDEEKRQVAVTNEILITKAESLEAEAKLLESQGKHTEAGELRKQANDFRFEASENSLRINGATEEQITSLSTEKEKTGTTILGVSENNQLVHDEKVAAETARIEAEKREIENVIWSTQADNLEAQAKVLESDGKYIEAGELRAKASDLRYQAASNSLVSAGATADQLLSLETEQTNTSSTIKEAAAKEQTKHNNTLAKQNRETKYNRITSSVDDFSADIQKTIIANPNASTLSVDENGNVSMAYTIIDAEGNVTTSDMPIASSISEYMFKNGEGVSSISTEYWPLVEEYGKKLGIINPDGSIADTDGLIILTSAINGIGDSIPASSKPGYVDPSSHTSAYESAMSIYYDPTKTPEEVKLAMEYWYDNGMTAEEYESIDLSKRDNPATRRYKEVVDIAGAKINDIAASISDKKDALNPTHAKYLLDYDKSLETSIYTWCVNHPNATGEEVQAFAEQVGTDLLYNEYYKSIEKDIEISLRNSSILEDVSVEYVVKGSVDSVYQTYLDGDLSHLVNREALYIAKTSISADTFSSEEDLFEALSQYIYKKPYKDLGQYEQSSVLVNAAICVKDTSLYNSAKKYPESVGRKTAEVYVEGYGSAAVDENGVLYLVNQNTGKCEIRNVGKSVYTSSLKGESQRIEIDSSLPVSYYMQTPSAPEPVDAGYGYEDIYGTYSQNPLEGQNLVNTTVDAVKLGASVAKGKEFNGVDMGTDIGSSYSVYNTGSGNSIGVGQGLGIFEWLKNKIFMQEPIGTAKTTATKKGSEIDLALLGILNNIEGGK